MTVASDADTDVCSLVKHPALLLAVMWMSARKVTLRTRRANLLIAMPGFKQVASNIEWRAYGKVDYGASHDFEQGAREWRILRDQLRQYGLDGRVKAVELGCGNGRLTNSIAREFQVVEALDVSAERLARAQKQIGLRNIEWHLIDGPPIPAESATVDLVVSTHVIQHIAKLSVVTDYFAESFRVLRPGGVLLMHIPVAGAHGATGQLGEVLRRTVKQWVKSAALPVTRTLMRVGFERLPWKIDFYRWYDYPWLRSTLEGLGFTEVEVRLISWSGGHSYVFARRAVNGAAQAMA
ncbi:MAG: class I SAM-dependent methyltransferase [Bryobacteraceae bacterium]